MASPLARKIRDQIQHLLFWSRRRFLDPGLDPRRDSAVMPVATYSPWLLDDEFRRLYATVSANTLVDEYRCYELWHLMSQVCDVSGDVLEVGVWRGGTGCLLAARAGQLGIDATVHLCDTFEGVVKTGDKDDHYRGGEHADTSEDEVRGLASRLDLNNVSIHRGIFPDDAPAELAERSYRFCHIDVDVYQSGKEVFDWVWERMPVGGIVVFDDFGFSSTRGITQLVHELEERAGRVILQNLNGHAVVVKTN